MSGHDDAMEFTGERFTPECVREIWYEHQHRYAFAQALARGKRVLDAACGEGYGSALLADVAASTLGVDIDAAAVEHAQRRYGNKANLEYRQGDATALDFLANGSFDLVCCFETLEHVEAQEALLAGFARLLAPDGVLLVSSPDKAEYSDARGYRNEFHVRELYRDELEALLSRHFRQSRLYAQKLLFQSVLWRVDGARGMAAASTEHDDRLEEGLAYAPLYYLAVCTQGELPELPAMHFFGDKGESVYSHYNAEVRKNMAAGARIGELEKRIEQLERQPSPARPWWRRLFG
jgi:SAM-dependent methyltransferase